MDLRLAEIHFMDSLLLEYQMDSQIHFQRSLHYLDLPSECWHFVLKTMCISNAVLCVSNYGLSAFSACLVNDKDIRMMMPMTTKITFSLAYASLSVFANYSKTL